MNRNLFINYLIKSIIDGLCDIDKEEIDKYLGKDIKIVIELYRHDEEKPISITKWLEYQGEEE